MKVIEKPSVVTLAAEALRQRLRAGMWQDRLPGTRVLAERLGLSAPTVAAALEQLAAEGMVEPGGLRRAYRVAAGAAARSGASHFQGEGIRDLLILTHHEPERLMENARRLLELLRRRMGKLGWQVRNQVVDFFHAKKPKASWDRVIDLEEGTRVLAVYGQPPLAEWAVRRNVRMLFLGGDAVGLPVPRVAVTAPRMAELAMAKLTALGHQRIVMPLCDRTEGFKEAMRAVTRQAVESAGGTYVRGFHNPESDFLEPDVMRRILQGVFAVKPPTALVLLDWKELVASHCYLAQKGLGVPSDVSLVILSDSITAEWFHPELCRFRFPQQRILTEVVKWLEDKPGSGGDVLLPGIFVDGDTIGAPPKNEGKRGRS